MEKKGNIKKYLNNIINTLSYSVIFFDDMRTPEPIFFEDLKLRSKYLIHFGNLKLSSKKTNIELLCNSEELDFGKLKRVAEEISKAVVFCYKKIATYLKGRLHLIDSNLFENIKKFFEEGDRFAISLFGYKSAFSPILINIMLDKEDSDPVDIDVLYHELLHYYYYVTKDSDKSISHMAEEHHNGLHLEGFYAVDFDDNEYASKLKKLISNIEHNVKPEGDLDSLIELVSSILSVDKNLLKKGNVLHVAELDHFDLVMNKLISATNASEARIEKILRLEGDKKDYMDIDVVRIALAVDQRNIEKSMKSVRKALAKVINYKKDSFPEGGVGSKYSALKTLKKLSIYLNSKGFYVEAKHLNTIIRNII